jgi:hypothetical protein
MELPKNPVREHFEARARDLADCATVRVSGSDEWPVLTLVPANRRSLSVELADLGDGTCTVDFVTEYATHEFEISDPSEVDYFLDAAIDGRVQTVSGPGRGSVQVDEGNGYKTTDTVYALTALFPLPGWRRRGDLRQYEPYRSCSQSSPQTPDTPSR